MNEEEIQKQADFLKKVIEAAGDNLSKFGDVTGKVTKTQSEALTRLQELQKQYKDSAKGLENLSESLKAGEISVDAASGAFAQLTGSIKKSGVQVDDNTKKHIEGVRSQILWNSAIKGLTDTAQTAATAFIDMRIQGIKTIMEALQNGGNAFDTYTALQKQNIDYTNKVTRAAADGLSGFGAILALVSPQFRLLGIGLSALGQLIGFTSDKSAELAKFGLDVLNKEVQKTISTYQNASKAGILFGNGMTTLGNVAGRIGIDYRVFIDALRPAAADLALLGGNAGAGAMKVAQVFKSFDGYRARLLKLGVSTEEQIGGMAEYMAMLKQSGQLEGKTTADIAKGTDAYLTNLRVITSITGEEARAAQARARKAAEQALVQDTLNGLQGESAAKFRQMIATFPGFETAISQLFTTGVVTNQEQAIVLSQNTALMKVFNQGIEDVKNSSVDLTAANQNMITGIKTNAGQMAAESSAFAKGVGQAALLAGAYTEEARLGSTVQRLAAQAQTKDFEESLKRAQQTKDTQDSLTIKVAGATVEFEKMQGTISQQLIPAMERFAATANATTGELDKRLKELGIGPGQSIDQKSSASKILDMLTPGSFFKNLFSSSTATQSPAGSPAASTSANAMASPRSGWRDTDRDSTLDANWMENFRRARERSIVNNIPQRADGGITSGPAIAGEAGPEAIIPLKSGSIPMNIDFGPLIRVMQDQAQLTQDLIGEVRSSKDIQEQILNASY